MSDFTTELKSALSRNASAIILQTSDLDTSMQEVCNIATEMGRISLVWNDGEIICTNRDKVSADELPNLYGRSGFGFTLFPESVIQTYSEPGEFRNSILILDNPSLVTDEGIADKDLVHAFVNMRTCDMTSKTVILITENRTPLEYLPYVLVMNKHQQAPRRKEIEEILNDAAETYKLQKGSTYRPSLLLTNAALGLTATEVKSAVKTAIMSRGCLTEAEAEFLLSLKKDKMQEVEGLIYHETTSNEVGGLAGIKRWLEERRSLYGQEAKDYGLTAPKGIFLVGPPGCGKSLSAKMIADTMKMPLVEFDHSRLLSRYVGEGEKITQKLFQFLNTCGPCVLWVDEIEKILPAPSKNVHESTIRLTGMFLTWLQERGPDSEVFVVCTSNNPENVPVELMRHGRVDQLFYIDLPSKSERREIIKIHLNRIHKHLSDTEIESLCEISEGYSGAEIATVIDVANLKSFNRDKQFRVTDVRDAFIADPPLSKRNADMIEMQRSIAKKFGISASIDPTPSVSSSEQSDTSVISSDYMYQ